jgi:hypothetical protein
MPHRHNGENEQCQCDPRSHLTPRQLTLLYVMTDSWSEVNGCVFQGLSKKDPAGCVGMVGMREDEQLVAARDVRPRLVRAHPACNGINPGSSLPSKNSSIAPPPVLT